MPFETISNESETNVRVSDGGAERIPFSIYESQNSKGNTQFDAFCFLRKEQLLSVASGRSMLMQQNHLPPKNADADANFIPHS